MRTENFTMEEFKALPRNKDGDIDPYVLSDDFMWFTEKQIDMLSDDDWQRVDEYQEEGYIMAQDFLKYEYDGLKEID
jgi:hypothetical protein